LAKIWTNSVRDCGCQHRGPSRRGSLQRRYRRFIHAAR
jgi:hypothetical protein